MEEEKKSKIRPSEAERLIKSALAIMATVGTVIWAIITHKKKI